MLRSGGHNLEWVSSSEEDVVIELLDGAVVELVISEGTDNDGSFEWTVPEDIELGDNYRIRCILADGSEQDISDDTFAITSLPTLTLTPFEPPIVLQPYGGGFWQLRERRISHGELPQRRLHDPRIP